MSSKFILAIETSCDETAVAVLRSNEDSLEVLSNQISSQVSLHAQWGGVVPNLAAREHVKNIAPLLDKALSEAKIPLSQVDLISAVNGPGLIPALLVGVNFAKTLAYLAEKPLIGIHHIEGHIYANYINSAEKSTERKIEFPALVLVVSGGHTQLVLMKDHLQYEIVGQTLDDAAGEAFDKVARILGIGYPGGPAVAQRAAAYESGIRDQGSGRFDLTLPRPMMKSKDLNFSFSGLKTAVLYETKKNPNLLKDEDYIAAVCHEFQNSAVDVLVSKTIKAAKEFHPNTVLLAGGVSANTELRTRLGEAISEFIPNTLYKIPDTSLTGDNAAMIASAAHFRWQKMTDAEKEKAKVGWKTLQADANLKLR
ncbi:MAG: putative tRNA threonylcarbamoyladenosine biosynthesis protein Gcp [Parcubacteria group bacterium GW2011_GWC1_45_14]|nr:MAG: putative tRNA threonylcarbamoyladenosine biosynthesis protein Gcp [Parcubacteria group bacterium GW2011_GWC1_45_14]